MKNASRTHRRTLNNRHKFRLGDRTFRFGQDGAFTARVLTKLVNDANFSDRPTWLLRHRESVRLIEYRMPRAVLTYLAMTAEDETRRCLAIWLRGRCGGKRGTKQIFALYDNANRSVRKEITRCLKRLSAWSELRTIATVETDASIKRLATQESPRSSAARLADYCRAIQNRRVDVMPGPLWIKPGVTVGTPYRGKSAHLIRQVLLRISSRVGLRRVVARRRD